MSDSTPKPNATDTAAPASRRPQRGRGQDEGAAALPPGASSARWWIASIVFHGALVAWLLFFSPVRVIDPNAKAPTSHVSAAQARKVVEQIREKQAATMEQNLRTLADIGQKIAALETRKRDEFTTFARELGQDVPARAAREEQGIADLQAEALVALDSSVSNGALYVQTRANAFFDDLRDAQKLASERQARVLQLQEQAEGLLSLGDARFAPAETALSEAAAAQDRAAKALAEAETASDAARGSRKRTAREGQIEHYTFHLRRNREVLNTGETNSVIAARRVEVAEAVLARRKSLADEAAKEIAAKDSAINRAALEAANRMVTNAVRDLASAQRRQEEVPKELENARKSVPELEVKVAELLAQSDPEQPAPTSEDRKMLELHAAARQAQLEAQQPQSKAAQAIAALQGLQSSGAAGTEALAALDKAAPPESLPVPPASANLAVMYDSAQKIESSLTQSYRRMRALNLALVRRLPLAKAIDLTDVTKPVRTNLSEALQSSVSSGEEAVAAREAVQTAKAEVGAMVRLADSLLSQARELDSTFGSTISTDDYNRRFDELQAMETFASEEFGGDMMDLSGMWSEDGQGWQGDVGVGEGGGPGGGGPGGGGRGGGRGGPGGSGGSGTGNGGAGDLSNMGLTGIAGPFGSGSGTGSGGDGTGNGVGSGANGPGGFGLRGIRGASGEMGRPENVADRVIPFPGRRVAARGTSARWFYADSWYILGPFDNTGRRNIDRKFPPEEVIDLSAKYPGKNGVEIRWEFQQSGTPNVTPHLDAYNAVVRDPSVSPAANEGRNREYIIYYAYTELWFEEAADLWVAIGSDDFSKVWIEDKLVWSSGKNLKPWQLNEGLRKVHFKKGVNRVLFRVENGNSLTEFSLVVSLLP